MRIGLALGGGVVRGLAHVGVLIGLERAGIFPSCISGSSAGALVGACAAAGKPAEAIASYAMGTKWADLVRPAPPWSGGFLSFARLERQLAHWLDDPAFEELALPFAVAVTRMDSGEPMTLCTGRVALAVHASTAIPGLVAPVTVDGVRLCDGSITDAVPVRGARLLGAEYVIGVNIMGRPSAPRGGALAAAKWAGELLVTRAGAGLEEADLLIEPDTERFGYFGFGARQALMGAGERAVSEVLPDLLNRLGR